MIKTTLRQAYKKLIKPKQFLLVYDADEANWRLTDDHVVEQGYCHCNDEEKHLTGKKLCRENGTGIRTRLSWSDLIFASRVDHDDVFLVLDFGSPAELYDDAIVCDGNRIVPVAMVELKGLLNKFKNAKRR